MKLFSAILIIGLFSCSPASNKTAADLTVRIADDVCQEIQNAGTDSTWIDLACTAIGAIDGGKVTVRMPRTEWHAIKARKSPLDAGPGK